ncbi:MAG: recombinase family protein [Eubacterium sp.]|nr:recombinase family protein [Eubacterium sp.]
MDIYATRERIRKENINFMSLPLRVTFYARVSTDFNVQLNSLDNQVSYYTDFIKNNPNWEYVDGYIDEGLSGVTTAKRERFNEMIEDGKAGLFDLIITKEVSRFARNTLDSIRYTRELLSNGVVVFFQNDNINTLDEDSELRLTIMSSMAQDESRKISSRVRFGHQQAIKRGTVLGTDNMYGYIKKDGKLTIDESEAEFVRELFEMYATGKFSMKQLEKHFYNKGIRNSRGKMLSHSTMGNIIRNPKYKGYYVGNKVRITDLFTKKQKFLSEDEWVMYKDETGDIVPAIVSEELWNRANEVLYMRSQDVIQRQHKTVHQNLLTGKLICAHCNRPYYRKDSVTTGGAKMSKWICSGKINNGTASCPSHAIYETDIKPIIEDIFKSGQQNIEELSACVLKLIGELLDSNDNKAEIFSLTKELETQQKMKKKLLNYNAKGQMSDEEFVRMTEDCDKDIAELQRKIKTLSQSSKTETQLKRELANIKGILKSAEQHIDGEEIDKAFIDRYIDKIIVHPDEDVTRFEIHLTSGLQVEKLLNTITSRAGHNSKKMIKSYEESMR